MYRFNLGGVEVQCDEAHELHAVLNGTATATRPKVQRAKAMPVANTNGGTVAGLPADSELPLVEGPLKWPLVEKTARQVGYKGNLRDFRSALKRRQAMEKA